MNAYGAVAVDRSEHQTLDAMGEIFIKLAFADAFDLGSVQRIDL
jgi:hypothetical protein